MSKPLIVLSDNPNGRTGLGRQCNETVRRIDAFMPTIFDVCVIGNGGTTSRHTPYPVYPVTFAGDYSIPQLPDIVRDFCGDEAPILFTIMNAGWLHWLAMPEILPSSSPLRKWLEAKKPRVWAYVPVDSTGPHGKLTHIEKSILERFDRVLAYTKFGAQTIDRTLFHEATVNPDSPVTQWLPHGTDGGAFYPRSREEARASEFGKRVARDNGQIPDDVFVVGIVATNSARKNWPLAFRTCAELKRRGEKIGIWAHTNAPLGWWDLLTAADTFGLREDTLFTFGNLSDEDMAWGYAACDVTLGIGDGEGWGMPLAESLACGIPVVTGDYAGATEFVPDAFRIPAEGYRDDGFYLSARPIFVPEEWADRVQWARGKFVELEPQFMWYNCWPMWEKWLREGVE